MNEGWYCYLNGPRETSSDKKEPEMLIDDSRNLLDMMEPNSVDVIITSPPYFDAKDYDVDNQIGFGQTYEVYLNELEKVLSDCYKVAKDTGSLWLIMDTVVRDGHMHLIPFELAQNMSDQTDSWKLTDIIIWNKGKSLPWTKKGTFRKVSEYIFFFRKGENFKFEIDRIREPEMTKWWVKWPERYHPLGKIPGDIWNFRIPTQGSWGNGYLRHFCPFPHELVERIVLLTTDEGDTVFDPFAGSGAVLATAYALRRKAIGIELNREYVERFYSTALPAFIKEYQDTPQRKLDSPAQSTKFEKISALTQLKYSLTFVQLMLEQNDVKHQEGFTFSLFIEVDNDREKFLSVGNFAPEMVIVSPNDEFTHLICKHRDDILLKSKLASYRIEASIDIMNQSEFEKSSFGKRILKKNLFVYSGSKFYDFDISLSESKSWNKYVVPDQPKVFANISIRLKKGGNDILLNESKHQSVL
ncbi:MAG: site-specific DNA-methyltransferase [Candidatus Thorarchaeota archaeon]|nr:site-specific DNA-methyltransferase [Candidatus Thorarchaeota archaeon]